MEQFELVEKLKNSCGVGFAEAKEALELNNWDLLEACVWLERQKQAPPECLLQQQSESSRQETGGSAEYCSRNEEEVPPKAKKQQSSEEIRSFFTRLSAALNRWIDRGNHSFLRCTRHRKQVFDFPLTAVVAILLLLFIIFNFSALFCLVLFLVSLLFGFRYELRGEISSKTANETLEKMADAADQIRYGDGPKA